MQPDLFVCKVCQLLLICAWAGFTPIPWRFRDDVVNTNHIFVNLPSLDLLWEENQKIQQLYEQSSEETQGTIYEEIIRDIFLRPYKTKARWVIENILFVEIMTTPRKHERRPNFRYFHIGQDIAYLFINEHAINAFRHITGRLETGKNLVLYLRRNVITRILEYNSLFPLCYLLLTTFLRSQDNYHLSNLFNILIISCIRRAIVTKISRGENPYMLDSGTIFGILMGIHEQGSSFNNIMDYEERKRKSYVLLSMIRNNRVEDFYHVLLQIYMSKNKPIPDSLIGLLNAEDEIGFHAKAYAFMSGFLGTENRKSDINKHK